jgi:transposase
MSGVISGVAWAETGDDLYTRYTASTEIGARTRLHALWLVRTGTSARGAARQAGVRERTVVRWLGWYRAGGLAAVLERVPGHGALGRASRLTEEQKWALVQESTHGRWRTYDEARAWVREHYGVSYSYKGLYSVLQRAGVRPKVPRPRAAQADAVAQEDWKRGAAPARSARQG